MKVPINHCKKWLAGLWIGAFVVFFFLMLYETQAGPLADQSELAWSWMFQNLLPTLSLIIAVLVADATTPNNGTQRKVERYFFAIAFGMSAIYLVAMMLTFILSALAFIQHEGEVGWKPLEAMQKSAIFLAPMQGLAVAALGVFFAKQK